MSNKHLVPVLIIDLINRYKQSNKNSNEHATLEARLIAIKQEIDKVLK